MSEEEIPKVVKIDTPNRIRMRDHKFLILVFGSVAISLVLVMIALSLYTSTGASQLDLSRPGYDDIRDKVTDDNSFKGFSSSGSLDKEALDEFDTMYTSKLNDLEAVDAFKPGVLTPESLQIK